MGAAVDEQWDNPEAPESQVPGLEVPESNVPDSKVLDVDLKVGVHRQDACFMAW